MKMKPSPEQPPWRTALAVVFLLLLVAVSAWTLLPRYQMEARNRAVGLVLDFTLVRDLAASEGRTLSDVLSELQGSGLTAVALAEETVEDLVKQGRLRIRSITGDAGPETVLAGDPAVMERVERVLSPRFVLVRRGGQVLLAAPAGPALLASVGIDPDSANLARELGIEVMARHANTPGLRRASMRALLQSSHEAGAIAFLPLGDQVLGNRAELEYMMSTLEELGMTYAAAEFVRLSGDSRARAYAPHLVIRLHAALQAEVDRMAPGAVRERYVRAFRERGIRWLLVRPPVTAAESPVQEVSRFLAGIREGVRAYGGDVRAPRPFAQDWNPNPAPDWLVALLGVLGTIVAASWIPGVGTPGRLVPGWGVLAHGVAFAVVALGIALAAAVGLLTLVALAVAIAIPTAVLALVSARAWPAWQTYLLATLSTALLALAVPALYTDFPFFLQNRHFFGVKLAHFLPIVLIGAWLLLQRVRWQELMNKPVQWGAAAVGMVLFAALFFMLERTGNESPGAVTGLELRFRALLDAVLVVRPRTKEFLVGHPALFLGLALLGYARAAAARGEIRAKALDAWAAVLLTVGMIGLTSIVNTLCHFHSPLLLAAYRIGYGIVFGGILGAVLWVLLKRRLDSSSGT